MTRNMSMENGDPISNKPNNHRDIWDQISDVMGPDGAKEYFFLRINPNYVEQEDEKRPYDPVCDDIIKTMGSNGTKDYFSIRLSNENGDD